MKKININFLSNKNLFNFLGGVIVLMVVAILAFWLNTLLSVQTEKSGTQIEINKSSPEVVKAQLSLTPTPVSIQITPTSTLPSTPSGWQTYTDKQLGFSIKYPMSWYKLDSSKSSSFKGQCFGISPKERLYNLPQVCIDLEPWVRPQDKGFASNSREAQRQFFENLSHQEIEQAWVVGNRQYMISQRYLVAGVPAIERIETNAPGVEVTEPFYAVSVYINHPQNGLIKIVMGAVNKEQFMEYKDILPQMLKEFSLLK